MLVSLAIENSFYWSALDLARVGEYTLRNFVLSVKDSVAAYCCFMLIKKNLMWAVTSLSEGQQDNCRLHWKRKVASKIGLFCSNRL